MKYTDLSINLGFTRNMRETNWLKLFPHWWSENDPLLEAIGKEIELIKAKGIFKLLNATIKPPVMIWQNSINHKKYNESVNITNFSEIDSYEQPAETIQMPAPLYKTKGLISITNKSKVSVYNLKVAFTDDDYIIIQDAIKVNDVVNIYVGDQKVYINNRLTNNTTISGSGVTYFKTSAFSEVYNQDNPLHNEALNIQLSTTHNVDNLDLQVDITLENAVFIDEQNIEVTGLELIPIKKVELYAYYNFPFNKPANGWRLVYKKEYDVETNVIYDMITTQFFTHKFYVDVYYKGLDYPYRVGFPCDADEELESIYHVNMSLDKWGYYLGLPRREYRRNIPEEDYPFTFPRFYPFNIEQDFWYYSRLINEYAWNDLAINDVNLIDTNGKPLIKLHSIDPFIQDFVVHARSRYPSEKKDVEYSYFTPSNPITQLDVENAEYKRAPYYDLQNLLRKDNNKAYVTLANKSGFNISAQRYLSKKLKVFFNLQDLPEDIHINDVEVLIEAESTDNSLNKFSNDETGIIFQGINQTHIFPVNQSDTYELEEKEIVYSLKDSLNTIKKEYLKGTDSNIIHHATIKAFTGVQGKSLIIPFTLKENDEILDDITEVYITYDGIKTVECKYYHENNDDKERRYIVAPLPISVVNYTTMSISCKTENHNSFLATNIQLQVDEDSPDVVLGPVVDDKVTTAYIEDEWHTGDLRNILQKDGIYFINTYENTDEMNMPTILIKNITLKIYHSPKQAAFNLRTQVRGDNIVSPTIAKLKVDIENIGDKELNTQIDIISANNLRIKPNYIPVDLNVGASNSVLVDIIPEVPILDGTYEILTVCEDESIVNHVMLGSEGLIRTSVLLHDQYGKYNDNITLNASVTNISKLPMSNNSTVTFYIDNFEVDTSFLNNNNASITININENQKLKYLNTGIHVLEARFNGDEKFASSRAYASLVIAKNDTDINISCNDEAIYNKPLAITASLTSKDDNNQAIQINEGSVSFYLEDSLLGTVQVINGVAQLTTSNLDFIPKEYTLTAVYNGTVTYARTEATKNITIIGGNTDISIFDINAKPGDLVYLKAKVNDMYGKPIPHGVLSFTLKNGEETITTFTNIPISKGLASVPYQIPENILGADISKILTYNINVSYTDTENIYSPSSNVGTLTIQRREVVIECATLFYGSQYEPLGFYLKVKDALSGDAINDGSIKLTIPSLNITCNANVESDGGVRIIHNPINFSASDFNKLIKFRFKRGDELPYNDDNNQPVKLYDDEDTKEKTPITYFNEDDLYRIYTGNLTDLNFADFYIQDGNLFYYLSEDHDETYGVEQIFIHEDGDLYARTNIDPNRFRTYKTGTFNVNIEYTSQYRYKNKSKQSKIKIERGNTDIDLHSYNLTYNDTNESITCYVTKYNLDPQDITTTVVNDGIVHFFADNVKIGQAQINSGLSVLPTSTLLNVNAGNHILTAEYISTTSNVHTYTYAPLKLNPITSTTTATLNRQFKGKKSKLTVTISIPSQYDLPITGDVVILLDNEEIFSESLLGIEDLMGNVMKENYDYHHMHTTILTFVVDMPDDIDINEHILTAKYLGDRYILPSEDSIILEEKPLPVNIETKDVYVAQNNYCKLKTIVTAPDNDYINEGKVVIYLGSGNKKAEGYVHNNIAYLEWQVTEIPREAPYIHAIQYEEGKLYTNPESPFTQNIYVIAGLDDICIQQVEDNEEIPFEYDGKICKTIEEALQCVNPDGNIHIIDYVVIEEDLYINSNVNIIGHNNAKIIKNAPDLFTMDQPSVQVYSHNDFNEPIYEIVGMTIEHLNTNNFKIIDNNIYYSYDGTQIFLLSDDKFYCKRQISPLAFNDGGTKINIHKNTTVNIKNVNIISEDNPLSYDTIIVNNGSLTIIKSILNNNVRINNLNNIRINNSLVYGDISGYQGANIDNNWWGSNDFDKYDVNNKIILKIYANHTPPVIGDDIQVSAELIGENNISYDLPDASFIFEATNGEFSTISGQTVENIAHTTFIDDGNAATIDCTIDDQTVSLDILEYDRKTEVILEPAIDIPIGYQIPIRAKVQSLADTYYKFNENNEVIEKSNDINEGFVHFYLIINNNAHKIGRATVLNGIAELPVFFSPYDERYTINDAESIIQHSYLLKAVYEPEDYYFTSENTKTINLIDGSLVSYVSPNADENGDGSFNAPFDSISLALTKNKDIIYLKGGNYSDSDVEINYNVTIKRYNEECVFSNEETIFKGVEDNSLILYGLTFKNNTNYIIDSVNDLTIDYCIFQNNGTLINDGTKTKIVYSSLVDNTHILKNYNETYTIEYCWFGTNNPNKDLNENVTFNKYIIMDLTSSKDRIVIGSVAHITASLTHYKNGNKTLLLDHPLPLRIATFKTTFGSLMPLKDYTHNNKSTSFLNTNEDVNSDKIVLRLDENKNYINRDIVLKCYVTDLYDNNIDGGRVSFAITTKEEENIILYADLKDGVAVAKYDTALDFGEYTLKCSYDKYSVYGYFLVGIPQIKITNFNINEADHLYHLTFNLNAVDSFDKPIVKQKIGIFIDDEPIGQREIINGVLNTTIYYSSILPGKHVIKLTTNNLDSEYETFTYVNSFISTCKDTYIVMTPEKGVTEGQKYDILISVFDKENRPVKTGFIDIKYDNETLYVDEHGSYTYQEKQDTIRLQNGIAMVYDFYGDQGRHSFIIHYSGDKDAYNEFLYINNNFNISLDEVLINAEELEPQLSVDVGKTFKLKIPVYDKYYNPVKRGSINLYLDQNMEEPLNRRPLPVSDGYAIYEGSLPLQTKAIKHDFTIMYTDDPTVDYRYADTYYNTKLDVHPIETEIIIDTIYSSPNINKTVKCDIESTYGAVMTGSLSAYYNDQRIDISGGDISSAYPDIVLKIDKLPANEEHTIVFKYHDSNQNYADSEKNVTLVIEKPTVNITATPLEYYPQQSFDLIATIKDEEDKNIDEGEVIFYIDGVEEYSTFVSNGQAVFSLDEGLPNAKIYKITIVYNENNYYSQTSYVHNLKIGKININDITLSNMRSVPDTVLSTRVIFNTPDNVDVTDGFVDFILDGNKINSYVMVEGKDTKYVDLNIPDIYYSAPDKAPHIMSFEYYDSSVFEKTVIDHEFIIDSQTIELTVPGVISASLGNNINIVTSLSRKTYGTLEYYLISIDNEVERSNFIGVQSIDNKENVEYSYELPKELEYGDNVRHYIQVKFTGNDRYTKTTSSNIELNIIKQAIVLKNVSYSDEVEYQDVFSFEGVIENRNEKTTVMFYHDNKKLGEVDTVTENGEQHISFIYGLPKSFDLGEQTITMVINESATSYAFSYDANFIVIKSTPELAHKNLIEYINTEINLPSNIVDSKGLDIIDGNIVYKMNDQKIGEGKPQSKIPFTLDPQYPQEIESVNYIIINMEYTTDNPLYNNFNDVIYIEVIKNKLNIELSNYGPITRGEEIVEELIVTSPSIDNITGINPVVKIENVPVTLPNITFSKELEDKKEYVLSVTIPETDIFYSASKEFNIPNNNAHTVTLSEAQYLGKAIDLVANNGKIIIDQDINSLSDSTVIDNNKIITIEGNNHTFSNIAINNNNDLTIKNLTIKDVRRNSAIRNNHELHLENCTFKNNGTDVQYGGAIYIDNRNVDTTIDKCVFDGNRATLYGGAIFSNQGNDVSIQNSVFMNRNNANSKGSSIASAGNIYISKNLFYGNTGTANIKCDIYIISGVANIENNYFDATLTNVENNNGTVSAGLNYWGYNSFTNISNTIKGDIEIDTWLISEYNIDYTQPVNEPLHRMITPTINKYRNRLDKESIVYNNFIDNLHNIQGLNNEMIASQYNIPVSINNRSYSVGSVADITQTGILTLIIGKEQIIIR